ncbi:SRPBCC family protein [Sinorhizobium numidicum]|uniref:SRPBCC family protein n=1 Tax=Sinorhizobium numidicum TaxID=680248 RepID=A0ABY8D036_9HYPH|nr:SRPBCC family protein [Sinorhizobium numidicum]WEX77594.1 SRPBCC family protein [Sinorhizobium numidicum]WEX84254.1 SRPBCC family protein [Sinorhizobium numidicum]
MTDRIEKSIELNAPIEKVWRALTDYDAFGEWFRVKLEGPFVVGEVTTGRITYPGHEGLKWVSVTERMDAPRLFSFRWPHPADPNADSSTEPSTLVEFHLKPTPTGTHLTIIESGFENLPEDQRMEALRGNEGGWEIQTGNIKAYVEA